MNVDFVVDPMASLLGFLAIFLIIMHVYGKLGDRGFSEVKKRLEALENDLANLDIRYREMASEIEEIKKKNLAYVQLFKTVVHGFDYIVQGTKTALGMEGTVGLGGKVVSAGPRQEIPEAQGEDQ